MRGRGRGAPPAAPTPPSLLALSLLLLLGGGGPWPRPAGRRPSPPPSAAAAARRRRGVGAGAGASGAAGAAGAAHVPTALLDALPTGGVVARWHFQQCDVCKRRWPPRFLRASAPAPAPAPAGGASRRPAAAKPADAETNGAPAPAKAAEAPAPATAPAPAPCECAYCAGEAALDLASEPQRIVLIDSDEDKEELESLAGDIRSATVVAFDAEWVEQKAEFPIAVLQLAFPESGTVYVIHRSSCGRLPKGVRLMLQDDTVLKVGWSCRDNDLHRLRRCRYEARSVRDIQTEVAKLLYRSTLGLSQAALDLLGYEMWKDKSVTMSDWTTRKLTKQQVYYAAMDAWVTLRLFLKVQVVLRAQHSARGVPAH